MLKKGIIIKKETMGVGGRPGSDNCKGTGHLCCAHDHILRILAVYALSSFFSFLCLKNYYSMDGNFIFLLIS